MDVILTDEVKRRLIYSLYIDDNIQSLDEHIAYLVAFECLGDSFYNCQDLFNECTFIISASDENNPLIKEVIHKLSKITINCKNISFIIEKNDIEKREGTIFKKYVLNKLDEYDGITLWFHLKGVNSRTYKNELSNWPSAWIIGQYFYLMATSKESLYEFIDKDNKFIYGWPWLYNTYYKDWVIDGACYWMKCQDIKKYIDENNIHISNILTKNLAEYVFPKMLNKNQFDYPHSNIIKNEFYLDEAPVSPYNNDKFINYYMQNTTLYNDYIRFIKYYNNVINNVNEKISKFS